MNRVKNIILIFFLICSCISTMGLLTLMDSNLPKDEINISSSDELIVHFDIIVLEDKLNIYVRVVNYSNPVQAIPYSDLNIHKFHIYTGDKSNPAHVLEGNLDPYNQGNIVWIKRDISLAWTGQGKFYIMGL